MAEREGIPQLSKINKLNCPTDQKCTTDSIDLFPVYPNRDTPPDKMQKKTAARGAARNDGQNSKGKASTFEAEQYNNMLSDTTASYLIAEQIGQDFDPFDFDWVLLSERSIALRILKSTTPNLFDFLEYLIDSMDQIDGDPDFEPWLGSQDSFCSNQTYWSCGTRDDLEQDIGPDDLEEDYSEADFPGTIPGGQGL